MDYKYLDPSRDATQSYTQDQNFEQPAAHSAAYQQNEGYGGYQANASNYPGQYDNQTQNLGQQAYQEGEYQEESAEPSLSDYNSHESCVRITTRK